MFLPNYSTTKEYLYVPALDINEQLVLPGKQSCSTQPLKFTMNGSIVLGSRDATNTRIENTVGEDTVLLFGLTYQQQANKEYRKSEEFLNLIDKVINKKHFGEIHSPLKDVIQKMSNFESDVSFVQSDFDSYCEVQDKIDTIFMDQDQFCKRSLTALAKCGDLSCDNSIVSYCQDVWNIKSVEVPNPSLNPV